MNYNTYVWSKVKKEEDEEIKWKTVKYLVKIIVGCTNNYGLEIYTLIPKLPIFYKKNRKKESKMPISKERIKIHSCNLFYFILFINLLPIATF